MLQSWSDQTFLHWSYDAETISRLLPKELEVDTFEGAAWVSLTPFVLANLHPAHVPPMPWISTSPETNVRTYVRGKNGERGIWFFSLDIARMSAALFGRGVYFLPYMWAGMLVESEGQTIRYTGRRRWPKGGAEYDITVEPGAPFTDEQLSDLDHFLTARFVLYTLYGPVAAKVFAEHRRWPLARAGIRNLEENLLSSVGLPTPKTDPLVHFSTGVDVRISRPYAAYRSSDRFALRSAGGE